LLLDFFLRAFNFGKYSPLHLLSDQVIHSFQLPYKPIDQAPKRFAAKIGFILTIAILAAHILSWINLSHLLAMAIILFALMESVFGFCAGCHIYTIYKKLSAGENPINSKDINNSSKKMEYSLV
jgi:apolipoprotein N-acyltransferase